MNWNFLKRDRKTANLPTQFINISSASHYSDLPQGLFIVEPARGKKSLGYHDKEQGWTSVEVGTTVSVNGKRITLDETQQLSTRYVHFDDQGTLEAAGVPLVDSEPRGEWNGGAGSDGH